VHSCFPAGVAWSSVVSYSILACLAMSKAMGVNGVAFRTPSKRRRGILPRSLTVPSLKGIAMVVAILQTVKLSSVTAPTHISSSLKSALRADPDPQIRLQSHSAGRIILHMQWLHAPLECVVYRRRLVPIPASKPVHLASYVIRVGYGRC
jgi:hypothetical protein